jgi:hypothetical protein
MWPCRSSGAVAWRVGTWAEEGWEDGENSRLVTKTACDSEPRSLRSSGCVPAPTTSTTKKSSVPDMGNRRIGAFAIMAFEVVTVSTWSRMYLCQPRIEAGCDVGKVGSGLWWSGLIGQNDRRADIEGRAYCHPRLGLKPRSRAHGRAY